jgi:hypothetical protein
MALLYAEARERFSVGDKAKQKFDMEKFNLKKLTCGS